MKKLMIIVGSICVLIPIVCALAYILGIWNIGGDRGFMAILVAMFGLILTAAGEAL